jgi:hypothetical protein
LASLAGLSCALSHWHAHRLPLPQEVVKASYKIIDWAPPLSAL